jgi:hypothetical protein
MLPVNSHRERSATESDTSLLWPWSGPLQQLKEPPSLGPLRRPTDQRSIWPGEAGGEGGIRTHGTLARTTVFETVPIDHSGTSPIGAALIGGPFSRSNKRSPAGWKKRQNR